MIRTGHQRHAGIAGDFTRFELVAHHRDVFGARTDESDLVVDAGLSQRRALGKKTVAGVERVAAGALRRGDDVLDFQVAISRFRWADADGAIGHFRRHAFAIGIRYCRDRFDPQTLTGANHPHRDLAAVGDQYSA